MPYGYTAPDYMTQRAINAQNEQAERERQAAMARDVSRESFEQSMLGDEQRRRQYDSETARMGQQQKYGVLGGLLQGITKSSGGFGGYGGYGGFGGYGGGPTVLRSYSSKKTGKSGPFA